MTLNPNASVPGIPVFSPVHGKQMFRAVRDDPTDMATPVQIVKGNLFQGAANRFRDYIPAKDVPQEQRQKPKQKKIVLLRGVDYMNAEDTKKELMKRNTKLQEVAKQIWNTDRDHRRRFKMAREIVENTSSEELRNPSGRVAKALKVLNKKPMSKAEAIEKALERLARDGS